jgi:hypothetical protein
MPPHWLPPAGKTKTPPLVVCFDTETKAEKTKRGEVHRLRCWDAVVRDRTGATQKNPPIDFYAGETAGELAELLECCSEVTSEVWALAHNLGFDLTVTALPVVLAGRGWKATFINLGQETCIFCMEKDKRRLVLTDSWSWLRCSLQEAARDVRVHKVMLPADDDDLTAWHKRSRRDAMILDKLVAGIMDWWKTAELGNFGITGPACGWRAMRSHIEPKSLLVGPEEFRTDFERRAIHGGRKEVYRVGTISGSFIADYDIVAAHVTTAAGFRLPYAPDRTCGPFTWEMIDALVPNQGAIVEATVTTDVPCAPCRIGDEVWWPTGRFNTVLTSPELLWIRGMASNVQLGFGQTYRLSFALADWAGWVLKLLADNSGDTPPVAKRVAKNWGRTAIGRFALRKHSLVGERAATHLGWHVEGGHDLDTKEEIEVISFGGREYTYRKDTPGPETSPAVLAFVEGYVRAALGELLASRQPDRLLQCNTDGWWERKAVRAAAWQMPGVPWPYSVTRRALERSLVVLGPNHVESPHERRFAGVPHEAELDEEDSFHSVDWPGLRWQIEHSRPGEYLRPPRETVLREHYCRSWVLEDGSTVPATVAVDASGHNVILPWSETMGRQPEHKLAAYQVPSLEAVR